MDMTGSHRIRAPQDRVWAALNDPDVLKQCVPGCEELESRSPTELAARVAAKVGPVRARFSGVVHLSDLDPPNGYRIRGEGSGGAAGFAKGGASVRLVPDGPDTVLEYQVEAKIGGKLAQIGSRLIDATARKMADDFFARFSEIVGIGPEGEAVAEAVPADAGPAKAAIPADIAVPAPAGASPPPDVRPNAGSRIWIWIAAGAGALALAAYMTAAG